MVECARRAPASLNERTIPANQSSAFMTATRNVIRTENDPSSVLRTFLRTPDISVVTMPSFRTFGQFQRTVVESVPARIILTRKMLPIRR